MALMKKVWAVAWIVLLFGALHVNGEEDNPCRHPEDRREGDGITGGDHDPGHADGDA